MKYANLGRTGVTVSKIALGTATFGVAPDATLAERMVGKALDLGVTLFDCANSYGNQARFDRPGAPPANERASAEVILGKALGKRRNGVVLCSKVMEPVGPGPNDRGLSRRHIFSQIEATLTRLGTDHLDIYYAHHVDVNTPIDETMRAFDDLVRQGKILYPAFSTFPAVQLVEALWRCDKGGFAAPVANQTRYNLAMRQAEQDLIPIYQKYNVAMTVYSPLAGGLFAGPDILKRQFAGAKRWGGPGFTPGQLDVASQLQVVSEKTGISSSVLALNWLITQPTVASAIVGPETIEELEASVAAMGQDVPEDILTEVNKIGAAK